MPCRAACHEVLLVLHYMKCWQLRAAACCRHTQLAADSAHMWLVAGAEEVSGKITRIITTFRKQLGMDAPVQMLTQPGTFAKALRLPDDLLEVGSKLLEALLCSTVPASWLLPLIIP